MWDDGLIRTFLSEGEVQAARRARLIVDDSADFCTLDMAAGDVTAALDGRIIYLRRVKLVGRSLTLPPLDYRDLDMENPGWEDRSGAVIGYVRNWASGVFRPYRTPDQTSTFKLLVVREPLAAMAADEDTPEIAPRYHEGLVDWALYRAYSLPDTEELDLDRAALHLKDFEREFGTIEKASAFEEEWQRLTLPHDYADGTF